MLDNGVGALDASNVSPDHQTAIEPLFAASIEVLRGPSAILYGSSAVGGIVNFIENTMPDTAPDGTHGDLELRGASATQERTGLLSVGGGQKAFGVHLNALKRKTENLRIPGVARIDEWDVTLSDGATYRVFTERGTRAWFVDGLFD